MDVARAVVEFDTTLALTDNFANGSVIDLQQRKAIRRSRFKYQRAALGACNRIVAAAQRLRKQLNDAALATGISPLKHQAPGAQS
jgi:hypothetical protein